MLIPTAKSRWTNRFVLALCLLSICTFVTSCGKGGGKNVEEKLARIAVWEDEGWTGHGELTELLFDESEDVRVRAALALGRVSDTLTLDSLRMALLEDDSPRVRAMAAHAFGIWVFRYGKEALVEAVQQERDPEALINILMALARTYASEEYATYVHLLKHPDYRVRAQAAQTLDMVNKRVTADSIFPLLDDPQTRWMAAYSLIRSNSEKAATWGYEHKDDPDPEIRWLAYRMIGTVKTPDAGLTLVQGMQDPDPHVRAGAADALAAVRDTIAVLDVFPLLVTETNPPVLENMIRAVSQHWRTQAADVLSSLLDHPDPGVRIEATKALCKRLDLDCADLILAAAEDPHPMVRFAFLETVQDLYKYGGGRDDVSTLSVTVKKLLDDTVPNVRAKALETYILFDASDYGDYLNKMYNDPDPRCLVEAITEIGMLHIGLYVDSLHALYQRHHDDQYPDVKWAIAAAGANLLPTIQIDSIRQDIIDWGMADRDRLVRWYTIAVARKFRQERGEGLGTYRSDLTPENVTELLHPYPASPRATIETTKGPVVVSLSDDWAPRTVRRFIAMARSGVYDNMPMNEIQAFQLMQTGDRRWDGYGQGSKTVRDEFSPLRVERGSVLWMSNQRDAGRGTFGIAMDRLPYLDWRFAVFGQVVDGLETVKQLTMQDSIRTITIEIPEPEA